MALALKQPGRTGDIDAVGEVLTERRTIAGVTKSIAHAYNRDGTVNTITYPGGISFYYGYDTAGRPVQVSDSTPQGNTYASSAVYAPQGAISSTNLSNGYIPEAYTYDTRLRVMSLQVNSGNTLNLAYGYSGNGDMSTVANNRDTGRNETFGYDQLNRLTSAQSQATSGADCWGQSIPGTGYDRYGNLLTINSTQCSSPTLNLTVSTKNRLTNTGFAYDNAGNLTFDGLYSYTWDAENRLKSANGVNYTYDGDLRRVEKSNGKLYWYSTGGQVLEETDLSGNLISDYVYFGGQRIARRDASGNIYYYLTDPLGTTRGIFLAGSTTLCYDADFYPFGGEKVVTNTCAQNYKFTGLERDAESGLDKTVNRMYTSNMGRWLSRDPLGGTILNPQSLNRYGYVLNNPTSLIDRSGLDSSYSDTVSIDPNDPLSGLYTLVTVNGSLGAPSGGGTAGALVHAPLQDDPGPPSNPGSGTGGGCLGTTPSGLVLSFYVVYGNKLNNCIRKIFGKDAGKVPTQTFFNSPNVNTSLSEPQVGQTTNNPTAPAYGSNNPSCGPNGTVYIANTLCQQGTNDLNAFWGTYVHELGNILDERLNPNASKYGYSYGNPDLPDHDTGAALETCVFKQMQSSQ